MKYAVYTGSRNLYEDMVTAAKSLAANSDVDKIWFLIEDSTFPYPLPDYVQYIDVSNQQFFKSDGPNMGSGYTYLAMMRAALCHVFPEADKILSLDTDTICVQDVSDIWDINLYDCYFSASKEEHRSYKDLLYTNTGVALYNLSKLRDGKADEVIDVLNKRHYKWVEQDVMNYLCQGHIAEMDGNYNANDWTQHDNPKIIHFAGKGKWRNEPDVVKYRDMAWSEIKRKERKVLIAVPTFDKAEPATFKSIYEMNKPCPCGFDYVKGYGAAKARNDIARRAINEGYEYVMMVDSDVVLPPNALELMLEGNADVVLGCYPRKNTMTGQSEIFSDGKNYGDENNISYAALEQLPDRIDIKGGGMGCALIRTSIFNKMQFPWFTYVEYQTGDVLSEDLSFCEKAKGFSIQADTRVRCGHIGSKTQWG